MEFSNSNSSVAYILLCTSVFIPLVISVVLFLIFRGFHEGAVKAITKSKPSFVSLIIVGLYLSALVFVFDVFACAAVTATEHEYAEYVDSNSINFQIIYVTFIFDATVLLSQILCMIYIFYHTVKILCGIQNKRSKAHPHIKRLVGFIIGKKNLKNFKHISDNDIIAAIFPFLLFLPIISFSMHCIYILLAWLTEPEKASFVLLVWYTIVIFLFYSFKSLYKLFSSLNTSHTENKIPMAVDDASDNQKPLQLQAVTTNKICQDEEQSYTAKNTALQRDPENGKPIRDANPPPGNQELSHNHVDTKAFWLTLLSSFAVVGFLVMVVEMFHIVPFHTQSLIDYVVSAFQVVILILSSQFALNVLFETKFDLSKFMRIFIETLGKKDDTMKNENVKAVVQKEQEQLVKVVGVITAEVTSALLRKYPYPEVNADKEHDSIIDPS